MAKSTKTNQNNNRPLSQKLLKILFPKEDKRKVRKLVQSHGFDMFIMAVILADAIVLGLLSSPIVAAHLEQELFILDRLFMGIFIVEMILKLYALGRGFFKSGWNVFDLVIVAVSSVPFASSFIVLRTLRLFRLFKFVHRWPMLATIIDTFLALVPAILGLGVVFVILYYAFAIIAVNLYGNILIEFATLKSSLLMTLETFRINGWMTPAALRVMNIFPHAWMFFGAQSLVASLLAVSFVATAVAETVKRLAKKSA